MEAGPLLSVLHDQPRATQQEQEGATQDDGQS